MESTVLQRIELTKLVEFGDQHLVELRYSSGKLTAIVANSFDEVVSFRDFQRLCREQLGHPIAHESQAAALRKRRERWLEALQEALQ